MNIFLFDDYTTESYFGDNPGADPLDPAELDGTNLRRCLMGYGGMDDDGPMIPFDRAEPLDDYFSKVHGAGRL